MCKIFRRYKDIKYWFKHQTKYRWQRGKHGFADNDVWSLDVYLAGVISASVRKLSTSPVGGHPAHEDFCDVISCGLHCSGDDRWLAVLDEIAEGFEMYANEQNTEKLNKSLWLFSKYFTGLWD